MQALSYSTIVYTVLDGSPPSQTEPCSLYHRPTCHGSFFKWNSSAFSIRAKARPRLSIVLSKMDIQPFSVLGHFIIENDRLAESVVDVALYFQFRYQCVYDDFLRAWCFFVYDDLAFHVLHNVMVLNNLPFEAAHC